MLPVSAPLESVPVGPRGGKADGAGEGPGPVLRDVLLWLRRLAPVRATDLAVVLPAAFPERVLLRGACVDEPPPFHPSPF